MSYRTILVTGLATLCVALAACDSGSPTSPKATIPSCAVSKSKSITIEIAKSDWTLSNNVDVLFGTDTTTSFSGSFDFPTRSITGVNPGDTVSVRLIFRSPLAVRAPIPPYVTVSTGDQLSGYVAKSGYATVEEGGRWNLDVTSGAVISSTLSNANVDGCWINTQSTTIAKGDQLYCLVAKFQIPTAVQGHALPQNLTVPFNYVLWSCSLQGNYKDTPPPVYAE